MQQINGNIQSKDTQIIEQYTTVYHIELGKGQVVTVTYRRNNNLIMCYFPNGKCHEWITEKELRGGVGDITLTKTLPTAKNEEIPDSLQSALESLFSPTK